MTYLVKSIPLTLVFKLLILAFVVNSLLVTLISRLSLSVSFSFILVFNELKSAFSTKSFATLLLNLATSVGSVPNFGISNLSTSVFKAVKLVFKGKLLVSTCVIPSRSFFSHYPFKFKIYSFIEDDSDKYFGT